MKCVYCGNDFEVSEADVQRGWTTCSTCGEDTLVPGKPGKSEEVPIREG